MGTDPKKTETDPKKTDPKKTDPKKTETDPKKTKPTCAVNTDKNGCTTDECYFVPEIAEFPAVTKDSFLCAPKAVTYSCTDGATVQDPASDAQTALITKCKGTTNGVFEKAEDCTKIDAKCVATQTAFVAVKKPAVPAKCVAKTCANYVKDKATCEAAKCVYTAKKDAVTGTFKCASQTGSKGDTKTKCDAATTSCGVTDNGGSACCKSVPGDTKSVPGSPATCTKPKTETTTKKTETTTKKTETTTKKTETTPLSATTSNMMASVTTLIVAFVMTF